MTDAGFKCACCSEVLPAADTPHSHDDCLSYLREHPQLLTDEAELAKFEALYEFATPVLRAVATIRALKAALGRSIISPWRVSSIAGTRRRET